MPIADDRPVAHVRIDSSVPHLDRVFDYAVPARMSADVIVGVRVRVRFSGRLVDALVIARDAHADVAGALKPIERVISSEPVVTADTLTLIEAVAARYAGTFWDVFRAAVPPRHARAERATGDLSKVHPDSVGDAWRAFTQGAAFLSHVAKPASAVRAVWSAGPGEPWPKLVADAVRSASVDGGGVLVVVPDAWDAEQVRAALPDLADVTALLTADLGPEARYRAFMRVLRGEARVVIGTRSAVFAPVRDLRLVVVWNDDEEPMWEPHAPYWNARDVAALRSHMSGCALLIGAPSRSPETQAWCESGWARSLAPSRARIKDTAPIVRATSPDDAARDEAAARARIPHTAWLVAKEGVRQGPVLVQVARRGYVPMVVCADCRQPARCVCGGALALASGDALATCPLCGTWAAAWRCPECSSTRLRAASIGVERTAEEFGRAFPDVRIVWSGGSRIVRTVGDEPAIVVATPGAEPVAAAGYAAVVILDARAQLERASLRATQEAAHRWFSAALLARPRAHVVVTVDNAVPAVQALMRWDAPWLAGRELADRASAGLPPSTRAAVLRGEHAAIADVVAGLAGEHRVLGPVDGHAVVIVPRDSGTDLARQLRAITMARSSKGLPVVTVVIDPRTLDA